jgi:hypothetical protein
MLPAAPGHDLNGPQLPFGWFISGFRGRHPGPYRLRIARSLPVNLSPGVPIPPHRLPVRRRLVGQNSTRASASNFQDSLLNLEGAGTDSCSSEPLKFKLGHRVLQLRPLGRKQASTHFRKRTYCEHRTNVVHGSHTLSNTKLATACLSRSRIPAIRSTYYVRHCPAYRRRILHG